MKFTTTIDHFFNKLLSLEIKEKSEKVVLAVAIISYLLHLFLILLVQQDIIQLDSKFFRNPIAAIYTPFSFILIYEVYLLVFYLPKSISSYIAKQYQIITLIVIRRIFKDIANLELTSEWFQVKSDLQFTYDVATSLILFGIIYLFQKNINKPGRNLDITQDKKQNLNRFIYLKKSIAMLLVLVLIGLGCYTLVHWSLETITSYLEGSTHFEDINKIFFEEFFTVLIIFDVILLMASFFYSNKFHITIRNSGFVISTILLKVSFSVEGIINNSLIVGAVLFGFLILLLYNQFEKEETSKK
jgi:hypothetical protein